MPRLDATCPAPPRTAANHAPARSGERAAAGGGAAHLASLLIARSARHSGASRTGEPRRGRCLAAGAALARRSRPRFGTGAAAASSSASAPTTRSRLSRRRGLAAAQEAGFERLLREHREAWAQRWQEADVVIEGDPELQRAIRFALFHLMASVGDTGEAAVGARGLSGQAYRGHVFWDSDVFVLPFLAATHPEAARAMLEYRVRRLPAARELARTLGRSGRPIRLGVGRRRQRRDAGLGATRHRRARPDPHGRARGAHRRRRRLGGRLLPGLDGRRSIRRRPRPRPDRRDCPLLGLARALRPGRTRAHLRRDRPRRVPRAG